MEQKGGSLRIIEMRIRREWKGIPPWQARELRDLFPDKKKPFLRGLRKGGRPRVDDLLCLEAIFWALRNGYPLRRIPERYGSPRTVARRLWQWRRNSLLEFAWKRYLWNTGVVEREEWRADLDEACRRNSEFWRLELREVLELDWQRPREKSVILDSCAESSPWRGGLTPPN